MAVMSSLESSHSPALIVSSISDGTLGPVMADVTSSRLRTQASCAILRPCFLAMGVSSRHASRRDECEVLAKKYRMSREVSGPHIKQDDVKRVNRLLHDKNKQLPLDKPGMIAIYNDLIYFESAQTL